MSTAQAQTVVAPDIAQARLAELQNDLDGSSTNRSFIQFQATVAPGESWIPVSYTHLTLPTTPYV